MPQVMTLYCFLPLLQLLLGTAVFAQTQMERGKVLAYELADGMVDQMQVGLFRS